MPKPVTTISLIFLNNLAIQDEMLAALKPQNALERKLAISNAWDTWRLDHLQAVENNVYTLGREEEQDENDDPGDLEPIDIALDDTRTYAPKPRASNS